MIYISYAISMEIPPGKTLTSTHPKDTSTIFINGIKGLFFQYLAVPFVFVYKMELLGICIKIHESYRSGSKQGVVADV